MFLSKITIVGICSKSEVIFISFNVITSTLDYLTLAFMLYGISKSFSQKFITEVFVIRFRVPFQVAFCVCKVNQVIEN